MPVTAEEFGRIALSIEGAEARAHFDRTAFRLSRTFATLAPDGLSANIRFTPEDQEFKCLLAPDAFRPLAGGWGRQGWTVAELARLTPAELADALRIAAGHARPKARARSRKAERGAE